MRKITYRGITINGDNAGKFEYGNLLIDNKGGTFIVSETERYELHPNLRRCWYWISVKPETVGLHSEIEGIYEGDVVRVSGEEPYENNQFGTDYDWSFTGRVVFKDGCFSAKEEDGCEIYLSDFLYDSSIEEVEILGNIHENPELLSLLGKRR